MQRKGFEPLRISPVDLETTTLTTRSSLFYIILGPIENRTRVTGFKVQRTNQLYDKARPIGLYQILRKPHKE